MDHRNSTPSFHSTKLRSLLPKNLLSQPQKNPIQVNAMQVVSNPNVRSTLNTNTVTSSAFQVGEIIIAQPGDEIGSLPDGTEDATSETVDNMLKVHFNGSSAPAHVVALSEAQVQKLLAMSPSDDDNSKQPVLHMVTIEEGEEAQPLSMALGEHHLPVSLDHHQVEEPSILETNPLSEMSSSSPLSATMTAPTSFSSQNLSLNTAQATPKMHSGPLMQRQPTAEPQVLHVDVIPSTNMPKVDKDKGEVVKKTMVEAFVKMVVCRKVTIQTINQSTGQVLDTKVKLEEEEPVILGVDCVETTEDLVSLASSVSQDDKMFTIKPSGSLDSGLKFLSTVSESQQKLGKNLLTNVLLKSTLKRGALANELISEETGAWKSVQVSEGEERESNIEEGHKFSNFKWNEEECNDESEDYVPSKDEHSKIFSKQKIRHSGRQHVLGNGNSNKAKNRESIIEHRPYKKRGRKRRWDNALGIALNLRTCQFCNKTFKSSEACVKHMKNGKCVSSVFCFLCAKPFDSEEQLETHLMSHEEKSKCDNYNCDDCKRTYRTRAGYLKHFKMGTCLKRDSFEDGEVGDYACEMCSSQFSTEAYLKLHKYKVHENPSDTHTCLDCGKKFYSTQGFNKHRSGRPCTEPLKCKICGKTYSSKAKESFKIHMRHHRTEATGVLFECDECDRTYMTQMALNKHKLSHTGVKPYKCDICGKGFAMRYMVKDHTRTHTGERPYPCTLCGSTFSNGGHLARHMRSHENGTLFKRGRPKKARPEDSTLGLKVIDITNALQNMDRQTIQVVDSQVLDTQMPGAPMIIRTDNNTIIITDGWPAGGARGSEEVMTEQQSDPGSEVIAPVNQDPVSTSPAPGNS